MNRILLLIGFVFFSFCINAANLTFLTVQPGIGTGYNKSSNSIAWNTNASAAYNAANGYSSMKFTSANPADVTFSGNDVAGQFTYFLNSQKYVINGVISRPSKTGNTDNAYYFFESTVLGGATPTGKAWLFVIPGRESAVTSSPTSTSSDPVNKALNDLLTIQNGFADPAITSNGGGLNASISLAENNTTVTTVTATVYSGSTKTFSISAGADASKFSINASTGVLTFNTAPDYDNPTDVGTNNVYNVQVTVTDSQGTTDTQALAITITNTNDNPPIITSNGGGATATIPIVVGATSVTTVVATDADYGDVVTYSISGGTNSSLFNINPSTGALTFKTAAVAGSYQVIVSASDTNSPANTDTQTITVNVTTTDTTAPSVVITSSDAILSAGEACTISFKFSEPVQGFVLGDVSFTGGTLTGLTQNGTDPTLYTATFTQSGTSAAAPTFDIAANNYQDLASPTPNNGTAAIRLTLAADWAPPTVAVSFSSSTISTGESKIVTFTFSENPGNSFTIADISVTNSTISDLIPTADPKVWTASLVSTSSRYSPVVTVLSNSYTDPAGNLGSSGSKSITLIPPSIDLSNDPTSDTGISVSDNITTNRKPIISGKNNNALAFTSVLVQYYVNTTLTTLTYTTGSGISYNVADSTFTIDLSVATPTSGSMPSLGLPEGFVTLNLTTSTGALATNSFYIDLTSPTPVPTVSNAPISTYDATPTITGTATVLDNEILKVNVNTITYTTGDGNLSFNGSVWTLIVPIANKISAGTYPVTATVTDAAGNLATDITTNELVINASTSTIDLKNSEIDDTGTSSTDNITSNRSPIITGSSTGSDTSVKITVVSGGVTYIYYSVAISGGSYSLNLSSTSPSSITPNGIFPAAGLPSGTVQLTVEGNTSGAIGTNSFVIDYTAPTTPTVNSQSTTDTTPTITGTATVGAGDILRVNINGVTYTSGDGNLSFESGTWTLNIPTGNALSIAAYPTSVTITDAAGNIASGNGTTTITNISASVTIDLANTPESDTGTSSTDNVTTNRKPVIVGTSTVDVTVTVSIVSDGITYTYNNVAVSGGNWTLNLATAATTSGATLPSLGLAEGAVSLTVTGNTTAAIANNTFQLNFISTTTENGTWTTDTKWDTEMNPNSEVAEAVIKHAISIPVTETIVCKNITVDPSAILTNNSTLTINDNLILKVASDNTASSIINNGSVVNNGRIIIRKTFSRDFGWYFMSFPFDVPADKVFIAGTNTPARWGDPTLASTSTKDFYVSEYDGVRRDNTGDVNYVINSPNWKDVNPHTFIAKKGYIVAVPGDIVLDFVSAVGESSVFTPVSSVGVEKYLKNQYTYHNSWNLIGIPYATSYKLNTASQAPFYSYNKPSSNYDVVMSTDPDYVINPYYSFFMQANNTSIDFSTAGRLTVKSSVIKMPFDEINITIKNAKYSDLTRIRLEKDASPDYVIGSDAVKMFSDVSAVPQIYSFIGSCAASYNTLPNTITEVGLTTKIGTKGTYSIMLSKALRASSYSKIVLVDTQLNKQQDLLTDSVYSFNAEVGTTKRFKVVLTTDISTDVVTAPDSKFTLIRNSEKIYISGLEIPADIKIFNTSGELLYQYQNITDGERFVVNNKGVLIVQILQNNTSYTIKTIN